MKLILKITIIYLLISLVVFALGGIITYQVIKREVDFEQQRFLKESLDFSLRIINRKEFKKPFVRDKISITPLGATGKETDIVFSDTVVMHSTLQRMEPHIKLDVVKKVKGNYYKISLYDLIIEEDDIAEGVQESLVKVYLLLFVVVLVLSSITSYWLLKPFNRTLQRIREFRLGDGEETKFERSHTREFDKLNRFLNDMTEKVRRDYYNLKEFTENASHEMQTPLSIINGKMELLLDDNNLTDEQHAMIISTQESIQRLSKMNNALGLLTKIENKEFENIESVNISALLEKQLFDFNELLELKSIHLTRTIQGNVQVSMDSTLCAIMFTNLLQNAIRHNVVAGKIRVKLDDNRFIICNTGSPLSVDPSVLFERFKKDNQSKESIGLGLAIVKKICDVSGFTITYTYEVDEHRVEIDFKNNRV